VAPITLLVAATLCASSICFLASESLYITACFTTFLSTSPSSAKGEADFAIKFSDIFLSHFIVKIFVGKYKKCFGDLQIIFGMGYKFIPPPLRNGKLF
jgi:hypothetical protein